MPKTKLFRVAIAVLDLDEAIDRYAALTGSNFTKIEDVVQQEIGLSVAVDWDVGIELITPLPGSKNPMSLDVAETLEQMGESVYSINFEVVENDMESAVKSGQNQGYHVFYSPEDPSEQQLRQLFGGVFTRFEGVAMRRSKSDRFKLTYDVVEYR